MTADDRAVLLRAVAARQEVRLLACGTLVFGSPIVVEARVIRFRERGGRVTTFAPADVSQVRLEGTWR